MPSYDVRLDVTEAAGLGEPLQTAATVTFPAGPIAHRPRVMCFAFPGAGYNRRYFTFDMPGSADGGQAGWHSKRGWVFVACDHLGVGDSSRPRDPMRLTLENLCAANAATVAAVRKLVANGAVEGLDPVRPDTVLGLGQSMGGALTIITQGQHAPFDGVGILGFSAFHTRLAMPPGAPPARMPEPARGTPPAVAPYTGDYTGEPSDAPATLEDLPARTWGFHYDDEPDDIVRVDMVDYPIRRQPLPPWAERWVPPCAATLRSAGVVAPEASLIEVPVLLANGERDVCADPFREPMGYESSRDVTVYVQPRASHMHNFATTRELFWRRIHSWGDGVAAMRSAVSATRSAQPSC